MSPRLHDLTGQQFGRLTVIAIHPERMRYGKAVAALWHCRCSCGEERLVFGSNLRQGFSRSCGCLSRDKTTERSTKHGHARRGKVTRAYTCWVSMLQRCNNANSQSYGNYGGRDDGPITVVEYYRDFVNWYADMGDPPDGLSQDRIDNDGHYAPGNLRWATPLQQVHNRRPPKREYRSKVEDILRYANALARAASATWAAYSAGNASWADWTEVRLAERLNEEREFGRNVLAEVLSDLASDLRDELAKALAGLRPLRSLAVVGTYDPTRVYRALDVVVTGGASFCARVDDPGVCPGDGWQMIAAQGKKGAPGRDGVDGKNGKDAARITSWLINRADYSATPIMSDGSRGAPLELRELFQRFNDETAP
jgi:hypothetical protein